MVIKILLLSFIAATVVALGLLIVLSADDQGAPSKEQLVSELKMETPATVASNALVPQEVHIVKFHQNLSQTERPDDQL